MSFLGGDFPRPGAFFRRNPGFIEHARETGLAGMPQLGVAYPRHHRFHFGALLASFQPRLSISHFAAHG